jgi:hypothetical protein
VRRRTAGGAGGALPARWVAGATSRRLAGLLGLLLAAPAAGYGSPGAFFDAFDLDGDGRVDRAEFLAYMIRGFDRLDANRNGVLDLDEQPPGHHRRPISREQQLQAFADAFHRQDVDGDGYLDVGELSAPPR